MLCTAVIYHSPCRDGFGAAFVAWLWARNHKMNISFYPAHPKDKGPPAAVNDQHVLCVDVCWGPDEMRALAARNKTLLVLDHHESNATAMRSEPYAIFDMERSGVMMAWDHFFPTKPMPQWLRWIGLYDLGRWNAEPNVMNFCTAFNEPEVFSAWEKYMYDTSLVKEIVERGVAYAACDRMRVAQMTESAAYTGALRVGASVVPVRFINQTYPWTNEIGKALLADEQYRSTHVALIWSKRVGDPYSCSLRSADSGPDVAQIAQHFGGGGHPHAAAFRMTEAPETLLEKK